MGIADIHIHSIHSYDATTTVRAILRQASHVGLNVIAITDHDEIRGSIEAQKLAPSYGIEVIPGAEISTKDGHLLALFINELPPPGLSLMDTLLRIGKMGGIAIAPHPFNNLPNSLSMEAVLNAFSNPLTKGHLLGLETHNMGTHNFDHVVRKISVFLPLAKIAASDAHIYWAVGAAHTRFPGSTASDFRRALLNNTTVPVPYDPEATNKKPLLSWMRHITLRAFGYASDSESASQPVVTKRVTGQLRKLDND